MSRHLAVPPVVALAGSPADDAAFARVLTKPLEPGELIDRLADDAGVVSGRH